MMKWIFLVLFCLSSLAMAKEKENEYTNFLKVIDLDRLSPGQKKEVLDAANKKVTKKDLEKSRAKYQQKISNSIQGSIQDRAKLQKFMKKVGNLIFKAKDFKIAERGSFKSSGSTGSSGVSGALGSSGSSGSAGSSGSLRPAAGGVSSGSGSKVAGLAKNKAKSENNLKMNEKYLNSKNIFVVHSEIYRLIQEGLK